MGNYAPGGCDTIALLGTNSLAESNKIYAEIANTNPALDPFPITNLTLAGFDYILKNPNLPAYTWYQLSFSDAAAFVNSSPDPLHFSIRSAVNTTQLLVANGMSIQAAIDAANPNDTVLVYPGVYNETAAGRTLFNATGPYQFGLFVANNKTGISVRGVDAGGSLITDYHNVAASVSTNATNNFGTSGIFVEANNVTFSGLRILPNAAGDNKTFEILGDRFTLLATHLAVPDGASVYLNDWRFDDSGDTDPLTGTSYVKAYTIEGNYFASNASLDIASGAGFSGPTDERIVRNNTFEHDSAGYWPAISFSGNVPSVGWYVYPVSGAVITGNSFSGGEQYIRARGIYSEASFDWAAYWNNNTFSKAVIVGPNLPGELRAYSYTSGSYTFDNVRRIGALIQGEVDHAAASDTVLAKAGTYTEQVTVGKSIRLVGAGTDASIIKAPATLPIATSPDSTIVKITGASVNVELTGFTVAGPGPSGCGSIGAGIVVRDGAHASIHHNRITDIRDNPFSGCQNGVAIIVGRSSWSTSGSAVIDHNKIDHFQKNGLLISNVGSTATISNNTVTGYGPTATTAQNGIQVSSGATSTITGNTVSDISYTPATWVATGILLYGADASTSANVINDTQVGIYHIEGSGSHDSNLIHLTQAGTGSTLLWGIVVDAPPPARQPQPLDADQLVQAAGIMAPNAVTATQVVTVTNNELVGDLTPGGVAIEADGGYGAMDIDFTASNNIIQNWGTGIAVTQCATGCTTSIFVHAAVTNNSLTGNLVGVDNSAAMAVDARSNWWDSFYGPTHASNPKGTGDSVTNNVNYAPWLCAGTDTQPTVTGFQPTTAKCTNHITRLVFKVQPSNGVVNLPLPTQPVVEAQDDAGNPVVSFDQTVTIWLANNPGGAVLSGQTSVNAVNGAAVFTGLSLDKIGTNYSLMAFSSPYAIVSEPFSIVPPSADLAVIHGVVPLSVSAGETFAITLRVNNAGPQAAQAVVVTDTLPAGTVFVSAEGSGWTCGQSGGVVTCTRASLAVGDAPLITITVTAPLTAHALTNQAAVGSAVADPVPGNNTTSALINMNMFLVYMPLISQ